MRTTRNNTTTLLAAMVGGALALAAADFSTSTRAPRGAEAQTSDRVRPIGGGRLIYDEHRRRVMLIDSVATAVPPPEPARLRTWSWDGREWVLLPGEGPTYRVVNAAVYDSSRRRIVMFGGTTPGQRTGSSAETWEVNGATWTQASTTNALARDHHTMVYDTGRGRTVLFGGGTSAPGRPYQWSGETWEWDGTAWTHVAASGPDARHLTSMSYDSGRRQVVLFGGHEGLKAADAPRPFLNDTWAWSGQSWRRIAEGGPPPRYGHAMVYDSRAGVSLIYGGSTEDVQHEDMWQWNGQAWSRITLTGSTPGPRFGAAMVYDAARNRTVLYGGRRGETSTWEWDGARWVEIK